LPRPRCGASRWTASSDAENYARAYAEESGAAPPSLVPQRSRELLDKLLARVGDPAAGREAFVRAFSEGRWEEAGRVGERLADGAAAQAQAWAQTIDKLSRALERGSRQWTAARKKESLQRVLESSGGDLQRLQQPLAPAHRFLGAGRRGRRDSAGRRGAGRRRGPGRSADPAAATVDDGSAWQPVLASLEGTVGVALKAEDAGASALADELAVLARRIAAEGATPELGALVDEACARARRWLAHRHHLLDEMGDLCRELSAGLVDLAEDDSWAKGQCETLDARLADGLNARSVRAASDLLAKTRERQRGLRGERERARDALKTLIRSLMDELGDLDQHTDRFEQSLGRYAAVIEQADSLDSLTGVVQEMVSESRSVHAQVSGTRRKLQDEQQQAGRLESRVRELEAELRQLSDEVSTDALTQVANRRGLLLAFEAERARMARAATRRPGSSASH
jgi:diguanylate cyclase